MDAKEVKEIRKKLGWTTQAFAERIGVSVSTVSRWENGKFKPSKLAVKKIKEIQEGGN